MLLRKIAIFRALQLGDLLCAIPAVRALKTAFPNAEIQLLGLPWAEDFVRRFSHYFSGFHHFPGFPGLPEQAFDLQEFCAFLTHINREKTDLLIQLHGNGSVINPLMDIMGASLVAGYFQPGSYCPDERLFMPYPEGIPEIKRHLKLMEFLEVPLQGEELEFPISPEEEAEAQQICFSLGLESDRYICFHPGARDQRRRWEPEKFARAADELSGSHTAVFTGTSAETPVVQEIIARMKHPAIDLSGKTSLGVLGALIGNAALLFSNDTGVSHIAAALKTPSVIIFLSSDPARWAPLDTLRHRAILPEQAGDIGYALNQAREALTCTEKGLIMNYKNQGRVIRVLTWHVHGSYLYYLSQTPCEFYLPVKPGRPEGYGGRSGSFPWGKNVHEVDATRVRELEFDCILFQSARNYQEDQHELLSPSQKLLPRIYLEHDPPRESPTDTRHIVDDPDMLLVHVTHFNRLMWNNNRTPSRVIEHGVKVPEEVRYNGQYEKGLVVINGLGRRGRRLGLDIFEEVRKEVPLDLAGMGSEELGGLGEIPGPELPAFMANYRFFFNPIRYTSLGLAVCEAMYTGLPVIGLATTEMAVTVENGVSGFVHTRLDFLVEKMRLLLQNQDKALAMGLEARTAAEGKFNIRRFTDDWMNLFQERVYHEKEDSIYQ